MDAIEVSEGSAVLVVGATGRVGTFAIQLAAAERARVIATARPGDEDLVTAPGAAETVDYTGDLAVAIRDRYPNGIDGLIDLVNRDPGAFSALTDLVREGGRAASALGGAGESTEIDGVAVSNINSNPAHLATVGEMVVAGTLRVSTRKVYPLADAAAALEDFTNQHTLGKLIVSMA